MANREFNIRFNNITDYTVDGYKKGDTLHAGYEGENEATRLNISMPSTYDGYSFYVVSNIQNTETTSSEFTSTEIEYDIPTAIMLTGTLTIQIKLVSGTQTLLTDPITMEIEKKLSV